MCAEQAIADTRAADRLEAFHAKPVVGEQSAQLRDLLSSLERIGEGGFSEELLIHADEAQALCAIFAAPPSPPPVVSGEASETFNGYSRATAERALARVRAWCDWAESDAGEDTNPRMCPDDVRTALALVSTPPVVEEGRREAIGRIIDPEAFLTLREIAAEKGLDAENPPPGVVLLDPIDGPRNAFRERYDAALAKADAILALTPVEGVGRKSYWLIERRCSPPLYSSTPRPTGHGAFYSDVMRAYRYETREAALAELRMMYEPERAECFVSEHLDVDLPSQALSTPVAAQGDEVREALEP